MDAWDIISRESKRPVGVLSDDFVMKYDRYMNWNLLSDNYEFSIDMLRMYAHRVDWVKILKRQQFHESFLREMALNFDENCWIIISRYQELSESFVNDFAEQLDWEYVLLYQHLSDGFILDHRRYYDNPIYYGIEADKL